MKRVVVLGLFALLTGIAYAGNPNAVNEKVLKSFKETFAKASDVKWYESGENYSVRFHQGEKRYIVYYDRKGNITGSMKFYKPNLLPANIQASFDQNFRGHNSLMVTEITSGPTTNYFVKMSDADHWYTIRFEENGDHSVYEKIKKQ